MGGSAGENTLFIISTALLAAFVIGHFINTSRIKNCPQSTAAIFVGVLVGLVLWWWPSTKVNFNLFEFNPDFFYFFLLPPIILEAGFSLDRPSFMDNLGPILWFAVIGTVLSAAMIAEGCIWFSSYVGFEGPREEIVAYCWLFGALLSAVDPVATLSILGGSRFEANERLFSLVFGESILNDAVAVVLYRTVQRLYFKGVHDRNDGIPSFVTIVLSFCKVTTISAVVGLATAGIAFLAFRVSKGLKKFPEYELGLLLLLSYLSFAAAEILQGSGILSLFLTGVILGHYNMRNLSPSSQRASSLMFKVLAVSSESFIYILFGVVTVRGICEGTLTYSAKMILTVFALTMGARAVSVFPSCEALNYIEYWKLSRNKEEDREADRKAAQASLRALLQPPAQSAGISATPYARSFLSPGDRRISNDTINTHQGSVLINPLQGGTVIEEESYFSRQTSFRGRVQERLDLIPVDSAHIRTSPGLAIRCISPIQSPQTENSAAEGNTPARRVRTESTRPFSQRFLMSGHEDIYFCETMEERPGTNGGFFEFHSTQPYISHSCQVVFWLAGLRGAVSFALAMALPVYSGTQANIDNINLIKSSTLAIVLITTICLGFFVEIVAVKFGIVKAVGRPSSRETLSPLLSPVATPLLPESNEAVGPQLLAAHCVKHLLHPAVAKPVVNIPTINEEESASRHS
eukprot:Protomagalhaensia_sp_Gyna_25__6128@NODE_999_length_2311_cov_42_594630_g796_i0_p1_GENE_NODE_999_length_2311_cov_42_594630_g796_i0NODE_999_length_2311_cov_42_594630_g796_i0_p1_ORF_typecomplete_len690_score113_22Na_H_Exchanger/PF00999_21/4_5e58Na_H_Exchanger/PF00999_21/0_00011Herpes_US12/PF05363_12/0_41FTCD_C/PF04961_12/0_35DUF4407/PF14362_6/2_3_NODE_999_length_2311_cov_42_594630_g796_i0842153